MDTEEFIDTLNSTLGIDLWPSVSATLKTWRRRSGKVSRDKKLNLHFRQSIKFVDIGPEDVWRSISAFTKTLTPESVVGRLGGITNGNVWYIIHNTRGGRYKIGYWGGGRPTSEDGVVGNSFDLNVLRHSTDSPIFLNINHQKPWTMSKGDIYIFEPSSLETQFMNWLNINPLEVK